MAVPPVGMHVLAVDDDPLALMVLQRMLQRCQYTVTTCTRVAAALELLRENKDCFDLVMSDVYMPDADGFKLLETVGLELDIPVIMMSANGETSVVMKGITHGACDYLIKPISMEELKTIWQHVARRRSKLIKTGSLEVGDLDDVLSERGDDLQEDRIKTSGREELPNTYNDDLMEEDINTTEKNQVHWSAPLHEKFVMAVNELGINKVSPRKILEIMDTPGLTKEHVANHLQKYKLTLKRLSGVSAQPGLPRKAIHSYGDRSSAETGREEARQGSSTPAIPRGPEFGENSGLLRTINRDHANMAVGVAQKNVMPGMSAAKQQKMAANRAQVLGGLGLKHGDGPKAPNTKTAPSGRKLRGGSADVSMQRSTLTGVLSTGGIGNSLGGSRGLGNSGGLYRMGSLDIGLLLKIQQEEEEEQKQREASHYPVDDAIAAFNSKHAVGGATGGGHRGLGHHQATQMRKVTRPPTARSLVNALPLPTASVDPREAEGIMTLLKEDTACP